VLVLAIGCGRVGFDAIPGGAAQPWWNLEWGFRKELRLDHTQVAGDVADFPVLVALDDPDVAAHAAADGSDLAFVDARGHALAWEIDTYSAGALNAWVKIPLVSASTDADFFLYFGGPTAAGNPADVWTNGYVSVFHFGSGATLDVREATGQNSGSVPVGAGATTSGFVGGAAQFSGVLNGGIPITTNGLDATPAARNTVTFWMKNESPAGKGPFAFDAAKTYDLWEPAAGCFGFNTRSSEALGTTTQGWHGRWAYVAAEFYNGVPTVGENALFLDGVEQTLTECYVGGNAIDDSVQPVAYVGGNSTYEITGELDEVHVAIGARAPEWIATEYANQSSPSAFIAVGSLEGR
jgi:hypothetical protein